MARIRVAQVFCLPSSTQYDRCLCPTPNFSKSGRTYRGDDIECHLGNTSFKMALLIYHPVWMKTDAVCEFPEVDHSLQLFSEMNFMLLTEPMMIENYVHMKVNGVRPFLILPE
jgi:hypothetical protein